MNTRKIIAPSPSMGALAPEVVRRCCDLIREADGILIGPGVVCVVMMEAGQITPPIGVNVFAISSASGVPMFTVFRRIFPFFMCVLLLVVLLVIFHGMAT